MKEKEMNEASAVIEVGPKSIVVVVIDLHRPIASHADKAMDFSPLIKVKGYLMFLTEMIVSF